MGGGCGFVGLLGSADHGRWTRRTAGAFLGGVGERLVDKTILVILFIFFRHFFIQTIAFKLYDSYICGLPARRCAERR